MPDLLVSFGTPDFVSSLNDVLHFDSLFPDAIFVIPSKPGREQKPAPLRVPCVFFLIPVRMPYVFFLIPVRMPYVFFLIPVRMPCVFFLIPVLMLLSGRTFGADV